MIFNHDFYVLYDRLEMRGCGTYGKVFRATNKLTNESVAIKVYDCDDIDFDETTINELYVLNLFSHKNIIAIHDYFIADKISVAMPFYRYNLFEFINVKPMNVKKIMQQILCGVNYMHSLGFIHRDLKTENILICDETDIKIIDFGFTKHIDACKSNKHIVYMTESYRAPEITLGSLKCDFSVDIWSLGCIMLELILRDRITTQYEKNVSVQSLRFVEIPICAELKALPNYDEKMEREVIQARPFDFAAHMSKDDADLLRLLFMANPQQRPTAKAMMKKFKTFDILDERENRLNAVNFKTKFDIRAISDKLLLLWKARSDKMKLYNYAHIYAVFNFLNAVIYNEKTGLMFSAAEIELLGFGCYSVAECIFSVDTIGDGEYADLIQDFELKIFESVKKFVMVATKLQIISDHYAILKRFIGVLKMEFNVSQFTKMRIFITGIMAYFVMMNRDETAAIYGNDQNAPKFEHSDFVPMVYLIKPYYVAMIVMMYVEQDIVNIGWLWRKFKSIKFTNLEIIFKKIKDIADNIII